MSASDRSTQEEIFRGGEANAWFTRNRAALSDRRAVDQDVALGVLSQSAISPRRVLEIGCANGWRLGEVARRYGSRCVGVEPSRSAIEDGKTLYPEVEFREGLASNLPVSGETFDLVIVNFVLHWVSRDLLIKSLAEIDRCVADGGHLLIGDFMPDRPCRVPYHHLPGQNVFTYKADYPAMFLATGLYTDLSRTMFDHATRRADQNVSSDHRCICALLRKGPDAVYVEATVPKP